MRLFLLSRTCIDMSDHRYKKVSLVQVIVIIELLRNTMLSLKHTCTSATNAILKTKLYLTQLFNIYFMYPRLMGF